MAQKLGLCGQAIAWASPAKLQQQRPWPWPMDDLDLCAAFWLSPARSKRTHTTQPLPPPACLTHPWVQHPRGAPWSSLPSVPNLIHGLFPLWDFSSRKPTVPSPQWSHGPGLTNQYQLPIRHCDWPVDGLISMDAGPRLPQGVCGELALDLGVSVGK